MAKGFFSRGFVGRRRDPEQAGRLPSGQYLTDGFRVLSAGPTPYRPKERWDFTVVGAVEVPQRWAWDEFQKLPRKQVTADIHCTKWSGFSLDTILGAAKPHTAYVLTFCDGGYATNLPLADVTNAKAWIVDTYGGNRSRLRRRQHRRAVGKGMAVASTRGRFTIVS
jgi:DMSO/TMAO reductase YedYZ molybdopterin-dependent catalytic subunit